MTKPRFTSKKKVASASRPGKKHTVYIFNRRAVACSCEGYTRHMPRVACRHMRNLNTGKKVA